MRRLRIILSSVFAPRPRVGRSSELGFTLIELLTIIVIISILMSLSIQSFRTFRLEASYSVARQTLRESRTALEGAFSRPDIVYPLINFENQALPGELTDPDMRDLFPGLSLSHNVKFTAYHDPACADATCTAIYVEVRPCNGEKFTSYTRLGDGDDFTTEGIPGIGCP